MSKDSQAAALKVLIAGAGIGGLSAAIALRQAGHAVEVMAKCLPFLPVPIANK